MLRREKIKQNIDITIRKLVALKDNLDIMEITKGQETFINTYIGLTHEYAVASLELLDRKKYNEALIDLEDEGSSFGPHRGQ